ncbi:hypothetical protein LCGC14_1551880 [marine sediment metagenome]|uniref:Uncharacterized protein n=1 Tax=marine sediment metagenome TaxID=412755 RepID=A0A0F9IQ34_9ZZZZ
MNRKKPQEKLSNLSKNLRPPPPQHPERNNQYRIQKVLKDRNSAINILLIKYLESTGYDPEDIIMCQSSKITKEGHIFKTWFEKKGEK